jgi:pimeloyl-ACP methyl ester carboxylesterase
MRILIALIVVLSGLPPSFAQQTLQRRGTLGVSFGTSASDSPAMTVQAVGKGSFAEALGIQKDDILRSVNGRPVTSPNDLRILRSGNVEVVFERNGHSISKRGVLPPAPTEQYQNAQVTLDFVTDSKQQRLRTLVTHPKNRNGRLAVIFLAGWLSCDTVEAPENMTDNTGKVFRHLIENLPFATFRMEKQGVGDSEGSCGDTDFETELSGYRAAFQSMGRYDFIDQNRVYILGLSNGAGFAPLVAPPDKVKGYVVAGGWLKTWYEHMMEIERRRLKLSGGNPASVNADMKKVVELYKDYLLEKKSPGEIIKQKPHLASVWPDEPNRQYGRPVTFYQQLQDLNLAEAWSKVNAPVLAIHGDLDWIMSREDIEMQAELVNKNQAGAGQFFAAPDTGHDLGSYADMAKAFQWEGKPPDLRVLDVITRWLREQEKVTGN